MLVTSFRTRKKVKERQKGKERKVFKGSVWDAVRSHRSTDSTRAEREADQSHDGSNYVSNRLGTEPLLAATGSLTTCRLDKRFIAQKLLIYSLGGFSVIERSNFVLDISPKIQKQKQMRPFQPALVQSFRIMDGFGNVMRKV